MDFDSGFMTKTWFFNFARKPGFPNADVFLNVESLFQVGQLTHIGNLVAG